MGGKSLAVRNSGTPAPIQSTGSPVLDTLNTLTSLARDPKTDPAKVREFMALITDLMAMRAKQEFTDALQRAQALMPPVLKDTPNPGTRSRYARLEKISEVGDPLLYENGFAITYGHAESHIASHYRITAKLRHIGGHEETYFIDLPADTVGPKGEPNKNLVHGVTSSTTIGRRILFCNIMNVRLVGYDDDGNAAGGLIRITEDQVIKMREMIEAVDAEESKTCAAFGVAKLGDIPAKMFDDCMKRLKQVGIQRGRIKP